MQLITQKRVIVTLGVLAAGLGVTGGARAWDDAQAPSPQGASATPSVQAAGDAPATLVPQTQVVYQTVNTVECVQVPVTHV